MSLRIARLVCLPSLGLLAFTAACGDAGEKALGGIPAVPLGGGASDGGVFTRKDGGVNGQVRIAILSPMDGIPIRKATAPELRVQVTSAVAGDPIDPTSVAYAITPSEPPLRGALFGPTLDAQFATRLDLGALGTGKYLLTVVAATRGGQGGSASITLPVDAGPKITIVSPESGGSYKGSAVAQILIDPAPSELGSLVEAFVGTVKINLLPVGSDRAYEGIISFDAFDPPLRGEQILRASATNSEGTRSDALVKFSVDIAGPVIQMTEPKEGSVVGGVIRVRATVADRAGVVDSSVVAFIGNKTTVAFKLELEPEKGQPGVYGGFFDTAKLTSCRPLPDPSLCIIYPNLSFRASDRLGNESVLAYDFAVDNNPPLVDLDPPDLRISKFDQMVHRVVCSWSFDPVGNYRRPGDPPSDGCAVPQVFDLRARIEDQGNRADGLKIVPISGIDPATTGVYVLDDTNQALVVDLDGDGACDAINPNLVPTTTPPTQSNQVLVVRLVGVEPQGAADFFPDLSLDLPEVRDAYPGCSRGVDIEAPPPLCAPQNIPIALGYPAANSPSPAIWALDPVVKDDAYCLGSQFDSYANEIAEGWACIAAAASDYVGTGSVSPPVRVWIQRRGLVQTGPACPAPPATAGPPPDCTGAYNKVTGVVSRTPCQARRYSPREVRAINQ